MLGNYSAHGMFKRFKKFSGVISVKQWAIVVVAVLVSISIGVGVFCNFKREVQINVDGRKIELNTIQTTVKDVLDQSGIRLSTYDYINLPADAKLQKNSKTIISIKRAVPINVWINGQKKVLMTYRYLVKDALSDNSIILSGKDRLEGAGLADKVVEGMNFNIIKVTDEISTEKIKVPFRVIDRYSDSMDRGKDKIIRKGKYGLREKRYKIIYEDGKQIRKKLLSSIMTKQPVNKVVEHGTVMSLKTSRGSMIRYKRVLNMSATSYTASYADTGKHPGDPGFGITYTGIRAHQGIVAVDPGVIPLGTRLYIEGVGNTPDYGYALAADIGGAVKGNIIDLYFEDASKSANWGRKDVKVYVLIN